MEATLSRIFQASEPLTFDDHRKLFVLEQHAEYDGLFLVLSESNTAMAKRFGISPIIETGNFRPKKGDSITLRVDKVCNKYPWERFKKEFIPPTDRSFLSRAYTRLPANYLEWLVKHYTFRYKNLPKKVLDQVLTLAQLMTVWSIHREKFAAGPGAFACPWVYGQMGKCLELRETYINEIIGINRAAKAYRLTDGRKGLSLNAAIALRIEVDAKYHTEANKLWRERPDGLLEPLPPGMPKLILLQERIEHGDA